MMKPTALLLLVITAMPLAAQRTPAPRPAPQPTPAPRPAPAPIRRAEPLARVAPVEPLAADVWRLDLLEIGDGWSSALEALPDAAWQMERSATALADLQIGLDRAADAWADLPAFTRDWPRPGDVADWSVMAEDAARAGAIFPPASRAELDRAWSTMNQAMVSVAPLRTFRSSAPAAWAPQDPADSLYRIARETLNRSDYARAATLFGQLASRYPRSAYAPDAGYWEAFARYRMGSDAELRTALRLLQAQLSRSARTATSEDAAALAARIRGTLAERGDRSMAAQLASTARRGSDGCDREEAAVRIEALNALARIDSNSVLPIVRRVLANEAACAASLRARAVLLLARDGSPEAIALLVNVARRDSSAEVQRSAVSWLGRVSGDRSAAALEELLRSSTDERLRSTALSALAYSDAPRARQVLRGYAQDAAAPVRLRSSAIDALARDTSAASAAWLRALYPRLDSTRLRERLVSAIGRSRSAESTSWLQGIVRDRSEPVRTRREALRVLAQRPMPIADLSRLYEATTEVELREVVLGALGRRSEPEATDRLLAIARSGDDPRLRRLAINLLSRKNDPRTAKLLLEIIGQ